MKIFFISFFLGVSLFGAHIDEFAKNMGYYRDYESALVQAKKENKVIMMVLVGDYCPWCRKFERKTLQRAMVAINIQKNFIPLIVDKNLDKENYPEIYSQTSVPAVNFIEPKTQKTIFKSLGYVKKDEYQIILSDALSKHKGDK